MKYILITFFFLIISCASNKSQQVYICGDHPCVNKAEMKDYFKNNISIEVYTITSDKEKKENLDLAQLNLLKEDLEKNKKINKSLSAKKEKKNIKKIIKERKKLAKLKVQKDDKIKKKVVKKAEKLQKPKNKIINEKVTFVRLCKNLNECDIDQISKIIMEMGKEKPYPDLTTQ